MREICTSGSVGGEGGNLLAYPALGLFDIVRCECGKRSADYCRKRR